MTTMATVHAEVLDEAYERLHRTGPEFAGWLSNHGPMAVDAMIRLGHPDGVPAWIDRYERRLEEPPGPRWSISEADWREALGDASRLGDWLAFFGRLVAAEPCAGCGMRYRLPASMPCRPPLVCQCICRCGRLTRDDRGRALELERQED